MHTPMTNKQQLIQQLWASSAKAYDIESELAFKRRYKEAAKVKKRVNALNRRIDSLIAEVMSDWLENSEKTISYVKLTNKELQRCIDDINNDVNVTENLVKAVGYIDDIVKIVAVII